MKVRGGKVARAILSRKHLYLAKRQQSAVKMLASAVDELQSPCARVATNGQEIGMNFERSF